MKPRPSPTAAEALQGPRTASETVAPRGGCTLTHRYRSPGTGTPRTHLIFGDIEGKLDVLRVECTRCDRKGRYNVAKLIAKHGRQAVDA